MGDKLIRANVTHEEGQKKWDEFCYFMSLALNDYLEKGGSISEIEMISEKRKEMTFDEWYDYVNEYKTKKSIEQKG